MTARDLSEFKRILKTSETKVQHTLQRRDGIKIQRSADASDEAQYAVDQELTSRVLDCESRILSSIRLALQRVDEGTYGICQHCQETIGGKRLAAVPWTCYCIRCQERVDSDRQEEGSEFPSAA